MAKVYSRVITFSAVLTCSLLFIGVFWSRLSDDHRDDEPRASADVSFVRSAGPPRESNPKRYFTLTPRDDLKEDHIQSSDSSPESLKIEMVTLLHMVYPGASGKVLLEREKEYMTALQSNLNHDHVKRIHVLTENARTLEEQLSKHQLSNYSKLLIVE